MKRCVQKRIKVGRGDGRKQPRDKSGVGFRQALAQHVPVTQALSGHLKAWAHELVFMRPAM